MGDKLDAATHPVVGARVEVDLDGRWVGLPMLPVVKAAQDFEIESARQRWIENSAGDGGVVVDEDGVVLGTYSVPTSVVPNRADRRAEAKRKRRAGRHG